MRAGELGARGMLSAPAYGQTLRLAVSGVPGEMPMLFIRSLLFGSVLLFSSAGFGQTSNTVFGAGYSLPVPINAAPGQILNLFVQGIGAGVTQRAAATSLPLPTVLAGISVRLTQSVAPES